MNPFLLVISCAIFLAGFARCQDTNEKNNENDATEEVVISDLFGPAKNYGQLDEDEIEEASGLASSRANENMLWVHNDSGNKPELFLINHQAEIIKTYLIQEYENRDWEDITIGPGPEVGTTYLYVGEIGDNLTRYDTKFIYRIAEPVLDTNANNTTDTLKKVDVIAFRYPEDTQNAEALMIDPFTKDIYIIAKNIEEPAIFRLASEKQSTVETSVLEKTGVLNFESKGPPDLVTAADISEDGLEVLVKTYGAIYYWKREDDQTSISELLQSPPESIAYEPEPQGEAITFTPSGDGFFTLSEKQFGVEPILFFYPRK